MLPLPRPPKRTDARRGAINFELCLLCGCVALGAVFGLETVSGHVGDAATRSAAQLGCWMRSHSGCREGNPPRPTSPAAGVPVYDDAALRLINARRRRAANPTDARHPRLAGMNLAGLSAADVETLNALAASPLSQASLALRVNQQRHAAGLGGNSFDDSLPTTEVAYVDEDLARQLLKTAKAGKDVSTSTTPWGVLATAATAVLGIGARIPDHIDATHPNHPGWRFYAGSEPRGTDFRISAQGPNATHTARLQTDDGMNYYAGDDLVITLSEPGGKADYFNPEAAFPVLSNNNAPASPGLGRGAIAGAGQTVRHTPEGLVVEDDATGEQPALPPMNEPQDVSALAGLSAELERDLRDALRLERQTVQRLQQRLVSLRQSTGPYMVDIHGEQLNGLQTEHPATASLDPLDLNSVSLPGIRQRIDVLEGLLQQHMKTLNRDLTGDLAALTAQGQASGVMIDRRAYDVPASNYEALRQRLEARYFQLLLRTSRRPPAH